MRALCVSALARYTPNLLCAVSVSVSMPLHARMYYMVSHYGSIVAYTYTFTYNTISYSYSYELYKL